MLSSHLSSFNLASHPSAHKEEEWSLSRINSQLAKANGLSSTSSPAKRTDILAPDSVKRNRVVFTDPVAFRYLEDDPTVVVLERRGRLKGYELYVVEQWACSRVHPTFVITTFTGDQNHSVLVGVLGIPADEEQYSPRLRFYFKAISQFHARRKQTPLGMLMVTNLSGFPSALTVIPVPDGDIRKYREDFIVNENLKRLGCSGRSGMNLAPPAGATQAKFHQLYRTSEQVPFYGAVIEMVKLCQVALLVFGKLEQEYADGLLCDVTEKAINDWWTEIGSEYYNTEPSDGILGPSTVAALLGMLMGARNRLNYYGAPVAKDAFDIISLKRGIAYFQKSQKIERTRRLDRQTLNRLHSATAKAAAGEGWAVPKAVKSTVAELSGKGQEMVMGIVGGGRDKGGIGDIETLDIDNFISLVHGERSKWLWHGKHRRSGGDTFGKSLPEMGNMIFGNDDKGGYVWSSVTRKHDTVPVQEEEIEQKRQENGTHVERFTSSTASVADQTSALDFERERDSSSRRGFTRVTGKMSDARSGFGRIKDAVGRRGHTRNSKEGMQEAEDVNASLFSPSLAPDSGFAPSPGISKAFTWKNTPEVYANGQHKSIPPFDAAVHSSPQSATRSAEKEPSRPVTKDTDAEAWDAQCREIRRDLIINEPSIAGSVCDPHDLEGPLLEAERDPESSSVLLHRRTSTSALYTSTIARKEVSWPRHMSFSEVEETLLEWEDVGVMHPNLESDNNWQDLQRHKFRANDQQSLHQKITFFRNGPASWITSKVTSLEDLETEISHSENEITTLHYQLSEAYQSVKESSQDILSEEKSHVTEAIKDIEVLGAKLEYEINALVSKVEDVEDGVGTFESHVQELEERARELDDVLSGREGYIGWGWRKLLKLLGR